MDDLNENEEIMKLSENKIAVKKDLRNLSKINITNLIKKVIDNNKIENVLENFNTFDSKIKSTKTTFDLIYRYLGEKIRKNELTLQDLNYKVNLLYILYKKRTEKILCLGGIEVLLPIFEYIYKNNNDKDFDEIIKQLSEILKDIFNDKRIIELAEMNHFFSILSLFIDKYKENQIKKLSSFYSNIHNIEKYQSLNNFSQKINNILNKKTEDDDESNFEYFENRKRYKKIKEKLFSFNGPYSDVNVFYNEKHLKYKITHFLTKEMVSPFLKPVLDMNLYKPDINKFKTIFNSNSDNYYSIDLNTFPFLEEKIPKNEFCKGCLIKITHHINGNIYFDEDSLIFIESNFNDENDMNNFNYDQIDKDKKTCFGNLISKRSGKGYFKRIFLKDIYLILKRVYYFYRTAYEIFTNYNKSFYFRFKDENEGIKFYNKINEKITNITFEEKKTEWKNNKISNLEYLMWLNIFSNRSLRDITQYPIFPWILEEYDLNKDLKSEPKYRNFKLPIGLMEIGERGKKRKENYLHLYNLMMDELNLPKQEKTFLSKLFNCEKENKPYDEVELEYEKIPYVFGSHFSNSAYVSHYLTRLFPFTLTAIEIQGEHFDAPDRLFINLNKTFNSVTTQQSDLREIIPEFFILPEMFININGLNLGKLQKNKKEESTAVLLREKRKLKEKDDIFVDEVLIPCKDNPYKFVSEYRFLLENSKEINHWIDLYFGILTKNHDNNHNLYMAYSYHDLIYQKIQKNKIPKNEIHSYFKLFELGFNPIPILKELNGYRNKNTNKSCLSLTTTNSTDSNSNINSIEELIKDYTNSTEYITKINKPFEIYGINTGSLFIYKEKELIKILQDHTEKIIDININNILNLFADISLDNYINIYTLPECQLLSSFKVENVNEENTKIYLSACPLPCIIIIFDKQFTSYNIYGEELDVGTTSEEILGIKSENFIDYLITKNDKLEFPIPYFESPIIKIDKSIEKQNQKSYVPRKIPKKKK